MANFSESFKFDQGTLGYNLATFEEKFNDFADRDGHEHASKAEAVMKAKAPWRDHSTNARRGLWADFNRRGNERTMTLGHSVEYGIYLEKSNEGRFQIIMPVLKATAASYMRSLEGAFAQMQLHAPIGPAIAPGVTTRPGTSQGLQEHAQRAKSEAKHRIRQIEEHGRQAFSIGKRIFTGVTKRTRRSGRR